MVFPVAVQARIEFTEVMYDPAGTDAGREWIEIHNTASETVDVSGLKLFEEGVNHGLKAVVGTTTLAGGQYAVIADDSAKFMVDWPAYSGTLYDSSFSLKNTGEVLVLRGKDVDEDVLTFDPMIGAAGDGNTLQKQLSVEGIVSWVAVAPTPGGAPRATAPSVPASSIQSYGTSEGSVPATSTPVSVPQSEPENISPTITAPAPSQPQGGLKYIPVDPQIFCKINGKAELFAGVEATFSAQSWGLKKQPLQNARYVWNFGDGQTKEGQYVLHTYTQPGTYELFLATASDVYSATDRLRVLVRSPQLSLSHSEEVMIIENLDAASMDLFGLKVSQSGRPDFVFPEYSMVSGRAEMTIDVVQFSQTYAEPVRAFEAPITLQYLNGRVVATSTAREAKAVVVSAQKVATKAAPSTIKKAPTKSTKTVAKPKVANMAAQTIDLTASSSEGQIITLDTTAKERRLNYYGATIGVLALLAFAWWYLLR
ncbi:MAG: lamin tail domain-containing protein [bacterium]